MPEFPEYFTLRLMAAMITDTGQMTNVKKAVSLHPDWGSKINQYILDIQATNPLHCFLFFLTLTCCTFLCSAVFLSWYSSLLPQVRLLPISNLHLCYPSVISCSGFSYPTQPPLSQKSNFWAWSPDRLFFYHLSPILVFISTHVLNFHLPFTLNLQDATHTMNN